MTDNFREGGAFIATGTAAGAGISTIVGNLGSIGSFGGVGIGITPVAIVGGIAGAAAFGATKALIEGDTAALGAVGIGVLGGVSVSAVVGSMGLAIGGNTICIGMGTISTAGGVVGLAAYGAYKIIAQSDPTKNLHKNLQALAEITREYEDKKRWLDLEIDAELDALKAEMHIQNKRYPVAFSSDGNSLITGGDRAIIKIWHQSFGNETKSDILLSGE